MNRLNRLVKRWPRAALSAVAATAIIGMSVAALSAAEETKSSSETKPSTEAKPEKKPEKKKKFTGAELYSMHCNRCHPERYATERTAAQWKTLMIHMRVRANLPAVQAKEILKYLQEDSGK